MEGIIYVNRNKYSNLPRNGNSSLAKAYDANEPTIKAMIVTAVATIKLFNIDILNV